MLYGRDAFVAVEVKHGAKVMAEDLRGLREFKVDYPSAQCALVYCGKKRLRVDGIQCIPCPEFLCETRPGRDLPIR